MPHNISAGLGGQERDWMRILGAVGSLEYNSSEAIPMLYDMAAARAAYNVEKYGTELDPDTRFCRFWPAVKQYWI